jgi:hypothetical protein
LVPTLSVELTEGNFLADLLFVFFYVAVVRIYAEGDEVID